MQRDARPAAATGCVSPIPETPWVGGGGLLAIAFRTIKATRTQVHSARSRLDAPPHTPQDTHPSNRHMRRLTCSEKLRIPWIIAPALLWTRPWILRGQVRRQERHELQRSFPRAPPPAPWARLPPHRERTSRGPAGQAHDRGTLSHCPPPTYAKSAPLPPPPPSCRTFAFGAALRPLCAPAPPPLPGRWMPRACAAAAGGGCRTGC